MVDFAVLEARVNAAAMGKLSNATATIAGQTVTGILDQTFVEQFGVEGLKPTFVAATVALPAVAHGTAAVINAVAYRVIGVQPDAGITTLVLERT